MNNKTTLPEALEESTRFDTITSDHTVRMRTAILSMDPDWLAILEQLARRPLTVHELRLHLNLPKGGTLGNRLMKMRQVGLVEYEELDCGTLAPAHLYHLIPEAITATAQDIRATARQIDATAAKIEKLVKKKSRQSA